MVFALSPTGRIGRLGWWLNKLAITVLLIVIFVIAGLMSMESNTTVPALDIVWMLFYMVILWWSICVDIKRYHDRGKSFVWIFVCFIPLIGGLWQLIELGFMAGEPEDNEYGSSAYTFSASYSDEVGQPKSRSRLSELASSDAELPDISKYYNKQQSVSYQVASVSPSSRSVTSAGSRPKFGKRA